MVLSEPIFFPGCREDPRAGRERERGRRRLGSQGDADEVRRHRDVLQAHPPGACLKGLRLGPVLADIDNFPCLALALRSPIDGMPIYLEMLDHAIFHDWYHFFSYLLKHLRKTYLNVAETEPG